MTKQLSLENLPFRHTCAGTTHKISVAYLCRPHLVRAQVSECKASIFEIAKFDEHWISRYQSHENIASMTSWGSCKNLHDCISTLVISGTLLSFAPTYHILHRSIDFKLVSDSCYSYQYWWWCTKFNPPTS